MVRAAQKGFTLLEILIAVAIFAMIGLAAYSMLNGAQRSQETLDVNSDRLLEIQRAFRIMINDIGQITHRAHRDEFGDVTSLVKGQSDEKGTESFVEFTRAGWRNPIGLPRSSLQHLRYQMNEDNQLIRFHWTYLDQANGAEPIPRILAEGVESIDFKFLFQKKWLDSWPQGDNTADTSIPSAVLVTLKLDDFDEITRIIRVGG